MCVCTRAQGHRAAFFFWGCSCVRSAHGTGHSQQLSGALLFLGAVSKGGFSNMRGSQAAISVRRKGWKRGWGSSSLSIKVGIDLWQLSIKVCESRPTCWEIGFPSPGEDEWPQEKKGQGFPTQLPEKNGKPPYLPLVSCSPFCHSSVPLLGVVCKWVRR